jgi:hypothetical protein
MRVRRGLQPVLLFIAVAIGLASANVSAAPPAAPIDLKVADHPWDGGHSLDVSFQPALAPLILSPTAAPVDRYSVRVSGEPNGLYEEVGSVAVSPATFASEQTFTVRELNEGEPYFVEVVAIAANGETSAPVRTAVGAGVAPTSQPFDGSRFWLLVIGGAICGSVVLFIGIARTGRQLYIRKIAGLDAVEEAVGRATEMGRSCLFVPGVQDINDIQTIAGLTILSRVAHRAAEYDARLEVPTSKSLVMTAARETVQGAYLSAGRPDLYSEDAITYVTDEQFGYVAYLTGSMVREKPAACFYMGSFFAESLILAETGNSIGAIQVAGTAQPAQLPFFVAACDYTLIGEEFFAASAYLSHDPDQLGSLKGQDVGKLVVAGLMLIGVGLLTIASLTGGGIALEAAGYLRNVMLTGG